MRRDDLKFLVSLALTLALAGGVIYSTYLRESTPAAGETVDVKKLEELWNRGTITLESASYWEEVEPPREGGP